MPQPVERCSWIDPRTQRACGFARDSMVHLSHDHHEAAVFPGSHCGVLSCHAWTPGPVTVMPRPGWRPEKEH